jgi:cytochrome c556
MRRAAIISGCVLLVAGFVVASQAPEPNDVDDFMQLKLNHAQDLLEALTTEDFEAAATHSQEISLLSQQATWQVLQTVEYNQHSAEFRRSADAVSTAAREKNLDAASLAYVDMTMKCFNCHKYVRGTKLASAE